MGAQRRCQQGLILHQVPSSDCELRCSQYNICFFKGIQMSENGLKGNLCQHIRFLLVHSVDFKGVACFPWLALMFFQNTVQPSRNLQISVHLIQGVFCQHLCKFSSLEH